MVKLTITHSCGHEVPHGFSGTEAERGQREQWLRERPCPACWHAEQSQVAAAQGEAWDLPPLEGTDEEKAWAEVIRMKALTHSRDFRDRVTDPRRFGPDDEAMKAVLAAAADKALKDLENQTSAAWWIENRFEALTYLKRQLVSAVAPLFDAEKG